MSGSGYDDAHCPVCADLMLRVKPDQCETDPDHEIACATGEKCYVYVFEEDGHPEMYRCAEENEEIRDTLRRSFDKKLAGRSDDESYPIAADEFEGHITEAPTSAGSTTPTIAGNDVPVTFEKQGPVEEKVVADCSAGNYLNDDGDCRMCDKDTYSVGTNAMSCDQCKEGFRADTGSIVCKEKKKKAKSGAAGVFSQVQVFTVASSLLVFLW